MTPTTAHWDFVSSIMNSGYHVELAGGGYHNSEAMSASITQLVSSIPTGRGITCNLIYSSPRTLEWQISLLQRLSQRGLPVDGLTFGAGVPSPDVITEYLTTFRLKHISFKPGSYAAIKDVIDIAKSHPDFPIILQWTGGRGGGHHSFEDFHAPILDTYSAIRKCQNIILVAGSGFGDSGGTYPYLTGAWATRYGSPLMPFDGILLGSRMMVAREAHTSPTAKSLIYGALGVTDSDWECSYTKPTGGVITVQSEMGQPIHKIANRGVLFWAEMDRLIFSLPRTSRASELRKHRDYIIRRLNADFAKPWFGENSENDVVDLAQMTYAEVLRRLANLMYVKHQKRWVDKSYILFVKDFAVRTLERFPAKHEIEISASKLEDPYQFVDDFQFSCPESAIQVLNPEDASFFLLRCKAKGQKPVNFIPSLDEDFEFYFKKDSLWQSEDIDAVIGQDAGRVCILHGPVAAQYSQNRDESACDILGGISKAHVDMIQREFYDGLEIATPDSGCVSPGSLSDTSSYSMIGTPLKDSRGVGSPQIQSSLTPNEEAHVCSMLSTRRPTNSSAWIRALFSEEFILQGHHRKPNPLLRFLQTDSNTSLNFESDDSVIWISTNDRGCDKATIKVVCEDGANVSVSFYHQSSFTNETAVLLLTYYFCPSTSSPSFTEIMDKRNNHIRSFYSQLWFGDEVSLDLDATSTFHGKETMLTKEMMQNLEASIGLAYPYPETISQNSELFPISIGIIVAWEVITKPLVSAGIDGDLLRLVHHSNSFEYCDNAPPLRIGDLVTSYSRVVAIYLEEAGKFVVVEGTIVRGAESVMTVTSTFLLKGSFNDYRPTFRKSREPDMILHVASAIDEVLLRDREWFLLDDNSMPLHQRTLLFKLHTNVTWKSNNLFGRIQVTGEILAEVEGREFQLVGKVNFVAGECSGNPVVDFLQRQAKPRVPRTDLKFPGWSGNSSLKVQVPGSNDMYARVSKDYNPIHVSETFAKLAELPGTITHGMYTSAITAGVIEYLAINGDRSRLRRFSAAFTGMVLPGDEISVSFEHTGMVEGRMLLKVFAFKTATDDKVLEATAEIEQARTAYIFTGQGSQSLAMGMDLYNTSTIAKAVWDEIDTYLLEAYGMFYNDCCPT